MVAFVISALLDLLVAMSVFVLTICFPYEKEECQMDNFFIGLRFSSSNVAAGLPIILCGSSNAIG